ncbi:hypothetical protein JCM11641_008328 [Rhodosporidiobolus odoratus]
MSGGQVAASSSGHPRPPPSASTLSNVRLPPAYSTQNKQQPERPAQDARQASTSDAGVNPATADSVVGQRPFRSKKVRPCDGCRKRKNRCAIMTEGEPCVECKQTGRQCTFLLPPPVRPKKEPSATAAPSHGNPPPSNPPSAFPPSIASTSSAVGAPTSVSPMGITCNLYTSPPAASATISPTTQPLFPLPRTATSYLPSAPATVPGTPFLAPAKRPRDESLANQDRPASKRSTSSSASSTLVSLDRDLPPGVEPCAVTATLTDDLLTYRTVGSSRQISSDRNRSQFILFHARPAHRLSTDDYQHCALRQLRWFLAYSAPTLSEETILDHYLRHLHPAFPILPVSPAHPLDSLAPGLRALLLAAALSYYPEHRKAAAFAWASLKQERLAEKMLEVPKLSSLAAAVVELDNNLDPRNDYPLLAKAIAHAQLLGLHVDCQAWAIPEWEKSLRERIWWTLRIHDAWSSFLSSRPSHIQAGNTNVPLPPFPSPGDAPDTGTGSVAFAYSCRLAVIVTRLQSEVSLLEKYGSASRVDACDFLEQELNTLKEGARPFFEMSRRPPGMDAFCFALLALRCMIRRVSIEIRIGLGNSFLPDGNTLEIFADLVKYSATLSDDAFNGQQFWLCYSSHILSSVLSSLIRLSLAAISAKHGTPPPTANPSMPSHQPSTPTSYTSPAVHLLAQLCLSIENAHSSFGWPIAEAALTRANSASERLEAAMQGESGGGEDYSEVVAALRRQPLPAPTIYLPPFSGADPLDGLNALASLAGGAVGITASANGEGSWPMPEAPTDFASIDTLAFDAFGMPELDGWLNVLDDGLKWGGSDGSPSSGWGLSSW